VPGPLILVVDDTPANLRLAQFLLTRAGYAVETAQDAAETWARVAAARPALVLMDLQLPGVDGLALTSQLKADPRVAGVPIVAMTAYAMAGDEARAREAGCDGYISKPIDPLTFAGRVQAYLASPSPG
jgi:two-component system cell cycle response regulator DivK